MRNTARSLATCTFAALLLTGLFGSCERQSPVEPPRIADADGLSDKAEGLELTILKTAEPFWEKRTEYDWTIEKSVAPDAVDICYDASGSLTYTLTATRTFASQSEVFGVRGEICVSNIGTVPTSNMWIDDNIWYSLDGIDWQLLVTVVIDVTAKPVLNPGETYCYPYEIPFTPVPGATYKNIAHVFDGEYRVGSNLPHFDLPEMFAATEYDAEADVTDIEYCPDGFSCTPSDPGPWHLYDSEIISFSKEVHNRTAVCNTYYWLENDATLEEMDSGQMHSVSAVVTIYTCPCDTGCTLTIGYWKTHAGFHGNNADRVTQYLPIWLGDGGGSASIQIATAAEAVEALSMDLGHPSNGITKLYAQLLGAKLNIARGASDSAISGVVADADEFLSMHDWHDWSSLTRPQMRTVRNWMTTIDDYNNGLIGPGHCDD